MTERALIPLHERLGHSRPIGARGQLDAQLHWAREIQHNEPRNPHRKSLYSLLGDSALNIDWLGFREDYDLATEIMAELKEPKEALLREVPRVFIELACSHELSHDIDYWLHKERFVDRRCGLFSRDPYYGPALTTAECRSAYEKGQQWAKEEVHRGALWNALEWVNPSGFVSCAALLYLHFGFRPELVFKSFLPEIKALELAHKLDRTLKRHPYSRDPFTSLTFFGSFELAFACGYVTAAACEGRFTLLGGIGGWTIASMSELLLPGALHYATLVQRAPEEWVEEAPAVFLSSSIFESVQAECAPLHYQLGMMHLLALV